MSKVERGIDRNMWTCNFFTFKNLKEFSYLLLLILFSYIKLCHVMNFSLF